MRVGKKVGQRLPTRAHAGQWRKGKPSLLVATMANSVWGKSKKLSR